MRNVGYIMTRSTSYIRYGRGAGSVSLKAISSLDGRYAERTRPLAEGFSEWALMKFRLEIEIRWLIFMSESPWIPEVNPYTKQTRPFLTRHRRPTSSRIHNFDAKPLRYSDPSSSFGTRFCRGTSQCPQRYHRKCTPVRTS